MLSVGGPDYIGFDQHVQWVCESVRIFAALFSRIKGKAWINERIRATKVGLRLEQTRRRSKLGGLNLAAQRGLKN